MENGRLVMFSDLDGTLINGKGKGVCVGTKNGKKSSYMSKQAFKDFQDLKNKIQIVPTTSRCLRSYKNVDLTNGIGYAMVENGAVLVDLNYEVDYEWLNESYELVKYSRESFDKCREIIERYGYKEKWGSDFVLDYTIDRINARDLVMMMSELNKYKRDIVFRLGNNYIVGLFRKLSKGFAIDRYTQKFDCEAFISAGDNIEDETMFKRTKYSIGLKNATYTTTKENLCDYTVRKSLEILDKLN